MQSMNYKEHHKIILIIPYLICSLAQTAKELAKERQYDLSRCDFTVGGADTLVAVAKTACAPGSTSLSKSVNHIRKARFHKEIEQFSPFFLIANENLFTGIIFTSLRHGSIFVTA